MHPVKAPSPVPEPVQPAPVPAPPGLDLGELDGPVMCFGGPYSNAQATEAVLAEARNRGIPPERLICTGDVVAYAADPKATVHLVRAAGIPVVMGNCEESLGSSAADCGCGFEAGSDCANWSDVWYAHAAAELNDDDRSWMAGLPRRLWFGLQGRRFAVIHGGADNISEYVFPSTDPAAKTGNLDRLDGERPPGGPIDGVIAGHSGLPFTQFLGPRLWHNPGAIGMPANDGTARGWYSVLAPDGEGIGITIHPLDYDHGAAARALSALNPDIPYAATLEDGFWPNMAVLPEDERRSRGRPLDPKPAHWPSARPAVAE